MPQGPPYNPLDASMIAEILALGEEGEELLEEIHTAAMRHVGLEETDEVSWRNRQRQRVLLGLILIGVGSFFMYLSTVN